jgi:single-strand DNA-binding protein
MSGSVNKHILVGHLGGDVKISANGKVATFSLATSRRWQTSAGEKREETYWHNVVVFAEHLVEVARKYLKKGSAVYLEGEVQTREYDDKEGKRRRITETVLHPFKGQLVLTDRAPGNGGPAQGPDDTAPMPEDYQ